MNPLRVAILASALAPAQVPEAGTCVRSFRFDADFPGYAGHFPGYAVLPAVVQVLTAAIVAEELAGAPLRLVAVDGAKFLHQLRPGDDIAVSCREKRGGDEPLFEARLTGAAGLAASFQLGFARATAC